MATEKTTSIKLTPKARTILEDLKDRFGFKELADVRDIAIAHAVRLGLEPVPMDRKGSKVVWGSAQAKDDLVAVLRIVHPDAAEKDIYALYQNLANIGLESLGEEKNYKQWREITDLPGFGVE